MLLADNRRLQDQVGKESSSIWKMNKGQLIEEASKELGLSWAEGEGKTVVVLRELLRSHRNKFEELQRSGESLRELMRSNEQVAFCRVPKGFERMKLAELIAEAEARSLPLPSGRPTRDARWAQGGPTRPQLIVMIRDDVDARRVSWRGSVSA